MSTAPSSVLVQTSLGFSVSGWACPAWLLGLAPGCAKISSQTPSAYTHPVTTQVPAPHPAHQPALPFVVFNDRVLLRSIKTPPSHFSVDSITPECPVGSPWSCPLGTPPGSTRTLHSSALTASPLPWLCLPRKPLPDESSASASGGDLRLPSQLHSDILCTWSSLEGSLIGQFLRHSTRGQGPLPFYPRKFWVPHFG